MRLKVSLFLIEDEFDEDIPAEDEMHLDTFYELQVNLSDLKQGQRHLIDRLKQSGSIQAETVAHKPVDHKAHTQAGTNVSGTTSMTLNKPQDYRPSFDSDNQETNKATSNVALQ